MKVLRVLAIILLVAVAALPLIPIQASGPTYTADINIENTSATGYINVPVRTTIPNFDYLVANGYITASGTDIQVTTLGGTKLPRMLTDDGELIFVAPSLPANSSIKFKLTLGNVPEDFAIISEEILTLDNIEPRLSATVASSSSDGYISVTNATYATARSAASGTVDSTGTSIWIGQTTNYTIYRSYLFFDTSFLPDDAVIYSAKIKIYGYDYSDGMTIQVQNGQPTYPHDPLVDTDYNMANYSGNGGSMTTTVHGNLTWYTIDLNSTGIGWINDEGITKLCLRDAKDISGTAPSGTERMSIITSEGGANKPVLEIVYESPFQIEFEGYINTSTTGENLLLKDGAIRLYVSGAGALTCSITSGPTVTVNGVSSGKHVVKVVSDGTSLKLSVDSTESSAAFTGSVPDTATDWIIGSSAMPGVGYYKYTVNGVLKVWYQPDDLVAQCAFTDAELPFPRVVSIGEKTNTSASTSPTLDLPSGRSTGDLLIASISVPGAVTVTWPDGWTALFTESSTTYATLSMAYRVADGTEPDSITLTLSTSKTSTCQSYAISWYSGVPEAGAAVAGNNPPSLTPSFGQANTLWLAVDGSTISISTGPANYTLLKATGAASPYLRSDYRQLRAASDDPGAYTSGNYQVTNTLAVCPATPYVAPDRAGGDQRGFLDGLISNPDDVALNLGVLIPTNIPMPQLGGSSGDVPIIVGESGQPGWTEDTPLSSNPFYPAVAVVSDVTNIPERQIWVVGALMCVTAAMLAVFKFVPHQLITVIVGGIVTALFVAQGILPFWTIFIFALLGIAIILWERVPSV